MSRFLPRPGKPAFLLGANYWPRNAGPRMWEADRFDEARLRVELRQARRAGCDTLRCFLFLPSMFRAPGILDDGALGRFRRFLELCGEAGVAALPSLLVGHMSGENFPFPGQGERPLYTDAGALAWQESLARAAVSAAAGTGAPIAWDLSNEATLFAGDTDVLTATAWAARLGDALRAADPDRRPVGTGDGLFCLSGAGNDFDPEALVEVADFLAPHLYPTDGDVHRMAAWTTYALRSLLWLGRPVLLEEFGASSSQASEENQALYVRETILTALALGAAGALAWCWSDLGEPAAHEPPYAHHPFEIGFGLTRADGSEKPACAELRGVARLLDRLDLGRLRWPAPRAALVLPAQARRHVPFSTDDRAALARTAVQAMVMAARACLEVDVIPEDALVRGAADVARYQLFLLPSTQKLSVATWDLLAARVRAGATLYWSWFGGERDFHHGAWCHRFEELTGCRHRLRYGVPDLADPEEILDVLDGPTLAVATPAGAPLWRRARLPVAPGQDVEILGFDRRGEPALLRRPLGDAGGQVLLVPFPWERWLAERPEVNETDLSHVLYAIAADRASIPPRYPAGDPRVETHVVEDGADDLVFCLNRSFARVATGLALPGHAIVEYPADSQERAWDAFMGKEARVFRVRGVRRDAAE